MENRFVGLLVSGRTELAGNARVLMTSSQALALGLGAGIAWGLVSLLRRKRA